MRFLISFLFLLSLCFGTYAEVYLTYDKNTEEIIDMSPREDVVMQEGWERIKLKGDLRDYNAEIQYHPTYYKYRNGKFVLNIKKVSDEELAKQEAEEMAAEEILIQEKLKALAIEALEAEGKKLKYFKKEATQ